MWYKLKRILIYPDGVTEKQVYPAYKREPNANTTLYLPLNWNLIDSYNNITYSWNWTGSYATWDWSVQAANFGWSNSITLWTSRDFENGTGELTYCFWFTTTSPSTEQRCAFNLSGKYFNEVRIYNSKLGLYCLSWWTNIDTYWTTTLVANTKYLATITLKENWDAKVYLNWQLEWTTAITTFGSLTSQFWQNIWAGRNNNSQFWRWMIKDFIIENKVRTADEVLNYYNSTK